jgi:hypothetical protein
MMRRREVNLSMREVPNVITISASRLYQSGRDPSGWSGNQGKEEMETREEGEGLIWSYPASGRLE